MKMELSRSNLIGLIETAGNGNLEVFDHWPGDRNCEACFFVMSAATGRLLNEANSTAVLSSRLPKILDQHRVWFDAIRTIGANLGHSNSVILTSKGTASDRYCRRIADLFRIKCVSLELLTWEKFKKTTIGEHCSKFNSDRDGLLCRRAETLGR